MKLLLSLPFLFSLAAATDTLEERSYLNERSDICGAPGQRKAIPSSLSIFKAERSASGCKAFCKRSSGCKSFAVGGNICWLFRSAAGLNFSYSKTSQYTFYDIGCTISTPTSTIAGTPATSPTATLGTSGSAPATTPGPDPVPGDSPSVTEAVDPAAFPTDDPEFTNTYTYTQYDLPTVSIMGTAPNTVGVPPPSDVPAPPCMIDATSTTNQFNVLGSDFVPVVASGTNLIPLASPTSEAQANAFGPADKYPLPAFYFEKPAGGPDGVYDMVMVGSTPKYVAKLANGNVVLTTSSTGAKQVTRNRQQMQTTLFSVSCRGQISVTQAGKSFTWDTSGRTTKMTAGTATKGMVSYPLSLSTRSRKTRRSKYNSGVQPRCVKQPESLVAFVRKDARGLNPNGCGPANGFDFVPDFTFGNCCNGHDNCFDDCPNTTFESCNDDFHQCMISDGCSSSNHWYMWLIYGACLKAADFYYFAVSTPVGAKAFLSATQERCACDCPQSLPAQNLCGAGNSLSCQSLYSNDASNCGACGRTCPEGTRCSGGNCICPIDKCGNTCLSLRNNPNNCGSCGNVCSTGYCQQGQCYTPPAACTSGFENGDFTSSRNLDGWNFNAWADTVSDGQFSGRRSYALEDDVYRSQTIQSLYAIVPKNKGSQFLEFTTEVAMCPGKQYRFDFNPFHDMGFSGGNPCRFTMSFGGQKVYDGQDIQNFPGGQQQSPVSARSLFGGGERIVGPFDRNSGGGVERNGLGLNVPFKTRVECNGGSGEIAYAKMRFANFRIEVV